MNSFLKYFKYRAIQAAILGLFQVGISLGIQPIALPKEFYILRENSLVLDSGETCIELHQEYPVFYILTHGTFSSHRSRRSGRAWGETEFVEQIPQGFFEDKRYNEQQPIRLVFGWSGQAYDVSRKEGGRALAEGINHILQEVPHAKIIVLGHSHGGNVINVASQYVSKPIDVVIQLATPILCYNYSLEKFDNTRGYAPEKIKQLYLYYSMNDFVQCVGAGHANFKRRYAPVDGIDLYNIRLLVNGHDPLHIHMHNNTIGKEILTLSNKIQHLYTVNKNLIANIVDKDYLQQEQENIALRNADGAVCIRPYNPQTTGIFTGKSTDQFWPEWNNLSEQENAFSQEQNAYFKQAYTKDIWHVCSKRERLYNIIDEIRHGSPIGLRPSFTYITETRIVYSLYTVGQSIHNGLQAGTVTAHTAATQVKDVLIQARAQMQEKLAGATLSLQETLNRLYRSRL